MSAALDVCLERLSRTSCCTCGIVFALPEEFLNARRSDGKSFHCPNGHILSWSNNSENAQLKRQAENLQKRLEWAERDAQLARDSRDATERHARAVRGHATRLRKRIAAGKCPCCSKTFNDLAKHIANDHPRYIPTEETTP